MRKDQHLLFIHIPKYVVPYEEMDLFFENVFKEIVITKDKYKGIIGRITSHSITGWVMKKDEKEPVAIELYKNAKLLKKIKADQRRQDIKKIGIHPTGECGFHIVFSSPAFSSADRVEAKIIPDGVVLDLGKEVVKFLHDTH